MRWRRGRSDEAADLFRAARADARRQLPLPWESGRYCAVDLETTGLSEDDDVLSFGAVAVEGGRVLLGSAVHGLVRPRHDVSPESVAVHRIRPDDLAEAPTAPAALDPLLRAIAGRVLIAHAAWVETSFLARALRGRVRFDVPVVDTAPLAWEYLGHRVGTRYVPDLEKVSERLGLPVYAPHDALGDAVTAAQVFVALARHKAARRAQGDLRVADLAAPPAGALAGGLTPWSRRASR